MKASQKLYGKIEQSGIAQLLKTSNYIHSKKSKIYNSKSEAVRQNKANWTCTTAKKIKLYPVAPKLKSTKK